MASKLKSFFRRGSAAQTPFIVPTASSTYSYKKRFALVGTIGAGKSSVISALYLTAMTLSSQVPEFICNIIEGSSDILDDISRLRRGKYPRKTPPTGTPIESGLLLTWKGLLGEKTLNIPICDVSGEMYYKMIARDKGRSSPSEVMANQQLLQYLETADGLLPVVAASRILMFEGDTRLESVPRDLSDPSISEDDDVNLARILNAFQVRKQHARKEIEAIGLIIHKYDMIAPYAVKWGMDLYDPSGEGFKRFMDICYPTTSMALKRLSIQDKVRYFPSHIEAMRDAQGNIVKWPDESDRIATMGAGTRMPRYSEQTFVNIYNWLRNYAV